MPNLRTLSANDVLKILSKSGFHPFSQRGSHIKLRRILERGEKQTLTIPNHREIDRGTLHAIFRQACRFIPEPELRRQFFMD
jgi:predicted RNA binding protein YcfA (HicA-like mRNA interferase family)